ncbi:MAG: phosphoribosylformylglycinamidine synthase subunit PurS [Blastocatellia bacterium]
MKAKVYVTLKNGVLDPQGKAIHQAIKTIGYNSVADIRQGKYFEVALKDDISIADAQQEVSQLAHSILANPVIEDYKIEIES